MDNKNEERKPLDEFASGLFSLPCIAAAELMAIYIVFSERAINNTIPDSFSTWFFAILEVLAVIVGVLFALFIIFLAFMILTGGVFYGKKYYNLFIEILILAGGLFYAWTLFT